MKRITGINAYEVIDSRGEPTIEVEVEVEGGIKGYSQAPSGSSKGGYEVCEIRDEDNKTRFFGKGLLKVKDIINNLIANRLKGEDVVNQQKIDEILIELDNTKDKSRLGGNSIIAVSQAVSKAAAASLKMPLYKYINYLINGEEKKPYLMPVPLLNVINGGVHADNELDIQEFMILPVNFPCFFEAIRAACEVYHYLKGLLKQDGFLVNVGDEGGFAPNFKKTQQALDYILLAIKKAGYKEGEDIFLGLDVAASGLFNKERKSYKIDSKEYEIRELISFYEELVKKYPIISIEDALEEDDIEGWRNLTDTLSNIQLVGDDLFVTNKERIEKIARQQHIANAVLVKPNQIGTLTEALEVIKLTKFINYKPIISHRSGETECSIIADIAVGACAGQIKTGAPARGERIAKYNRLIRIERELDKDCCYAGRVPYGM